MPRPHAFAALLLISLLSATAHAQWQMLNSNTTADLRGIDSLGGGVAWVSGTNGTVLRTEDGGYLWQVCSIPPGAEHLDFRAIQAFNANTAIVSPAAGRFPIYKTTDGCHIWGAAAHQLRFRRVLPDALVLTRTNRDGELLGDPVHGSFVFLETPDRGAHWTSHKIRRPRCSRR